MKIVVFNRPDTDKSKWKNLDYLNKLFFLEMKPVNISSTEIRGKIRNCESITGFVPEKVEEKIIKLYSSF